MSMEGQIIFCETFKIFARLLKIEISTENNKDNWYACQKLFLTTK